MPTVLEAPEFLGEEKVQHQAMTDQPGKQPTQRLLTALLGAVRAVVSSEEASSQTTPEMPVDILARQHPYLYAQSLCG